MVAWSIIPLPRRLSRQAFRMTYSDVNDILAGDEEKRLRVSRKLFLVSILMAKLHEILESMRCETWCA